MLCPLIRELPLPELRATIMGYHLVGITVDIVGINSGDRGRSSEEHEVCGSILKLDMVVRIKREQVVVDGMEETALTVNWVCNGIDRCRVGFLRKALVKHHKKYNGRLVQITERYTADCRGWFRCYNKRNTIRIPCVCKQGLRFNIIYNTCR